MGSSLNKTEQDALKKARLAGEAEAESMVQEATEIAEKAKELRKRIRGTEPIGRVMADRLTHASRVLDGNVRPSREERRAARQGNT
jgi:hypothetical protein